ncbi:MAG: hypothetical protein NTV93_19570 [Verrucomicrobia bacterium]|nr:hypothetical protein [Verrucomicrobiota bacterium]
MKTTNLPDLPDLHDGYLIGIILSGNKTLALHCRDVKNRTYEICIPKIQSLKADNFLEGNIIFEINLYSGSECSPELVAKVKSYNNEASTFLQRDLELIASQKWTLIELVSSYGCDLLALSQAGVEEIHVSLLSPV